MSTHRAPTSASGGFRAVGPRPPVPYQRAEPAPDAALGAPTVTVGEQAARAGWAPARPTPAHTPPRGQRAVRTGDGRALVTLRVVTYVLASLASLVFLALVVYGALALQQLSATFPRLGG